VAYSTSATANCKASQQALRQVRGFVFGGFVEGDVECEYGRLLVSHVPA
jgi:hypothetical protein